MKVQQLLDYIEKHNIDKNMEVVVNNFFIESIGECVFSPLQKKIGNYLSLESNYSIQRADEDRRKERFIQRWTKKGFTRDEAKEIYMDKFIRPYEIDFFGPIATESVFAYENNKAFKNKINWEKQNLKQS